MVHNKHFLIPVFVLFFSQSLCAEPASVQSKVTEKEQSVLAAGGAGLGAAFLSLFCASCIVGTTANGISTLQAKDPLKSFLYLNCAALFLYTALQAGKYSLDKFRSLMSDSGAI